MGVFGKPWFIIIILFLATALRLWDLPNNPLGLTWDEASLGYNAYSLLLTGKDEYGNFLPLNLKSFGDYKPSLFAYLDIPFVAIFGLNELAVRLPSAIFGVLGVLGIYLLTEQLFKKRALSLLTTFFLAISPWHIQFSRPAFEANVALTLNIFAIYFFLKALEKKKLLIISALLFGLSLLTYQASKMFVPLIISTLMIIYWNKLRTSKFALHAMVILFAFLLIIAFTFLSGQTSRLATVNVFAYQRSEELTKIISDEDGLDVGSLTFQVLHGQWWEYIRGISERYLGYFSPKMLFIEGDPSQRHKVPDLGSLYYFSIILIPLGLINLIKMGGRESKLLLFWLLLAPLPAILSRDLVSTLRALNMIVPWVILEAAGLWWLAVKIRRVKGNLVYLGIIVIIFIITINFIIYLDRYFIHAPKEYSKYWLYGYREVYEKLSKMDLPSYNKVVISDTYGQPYIYFLFYTTYPPEKFQKQAVLNQPTSDVGTIRNLDNIEFRHIYWPVDRGEKNALFAGSLEELPDKDILPFEEFKVIKEVDFLNGERAFRMVETK